MSQSIFPNEAPSTQSQGSSNSNSNQRQSWVQYPIADQESATSAESKFSQDLLQIFNIIKQVPNLFQLICDSIFSDITANQHTKKALVLALFGGTAKLDEECPNICTRDHIHVLLLGSRCSQKNQFLKCITTMMDDKSCYIVGSCSSLKLIATSKNGKESKSDQSKGALISQEQKMVCVDELEKMDNMQQQVIMQSIDHQHIGVRDVNELVAFHPSKVSIIAAANLHTSEYDFGKLIEQNVRVSQGLITKFDLIFLVDDEYANINRDDEVEYQNEKKRFRTASEGQMKVRSTTTHVSSSFKNLVELHQSGQLFGGEKILQSDSDHLLSLPIIRQYILYSQYIHPAVDANIQKILKKFVCQEVAIHSSYKSSLLRIYETLVRLAEAHAKLYMRLNVTEDDLLVVVDIFDKTLTLAKPQTSVIKRNSKSRNLKPKHVYQVLCEASRCLNKKRFIVEEIVELCLKYIDKSCDPKAIQDAIYSLNEQAMLLKKPDGYEVI